MAQGFSEDRIRIFESVPVPKAVMTMSVPTVLSSLVMIIYSLADTYFVGLLNSSVQTAAVTLAAPLLLAFNAINNLFGVGSGSLMSRCLGSKEYDKVKRVSCFGFYLSLACALLFALGYTVFQSPLLHVLGTDVDTHEATSAYLFWTVTLGAVPSILNVVLSNMVRSEGFSLQASLGTMSGCILNIILDPVFILPWGLNMGASGAGLATMLSNTFACLYFFFFLYKRSSTSLVCVNPRYFRMDGLIARQICSVGVPASIQNLLNVTGMTVLNNFTAGYGPAAVAAMGIAHKIAQVPLFIAMGISQGIMPLVSYNYASKNGKRTKDVIIFTGEITVLFMTAITVLCLVLRHALVGLFIDSPDVIAYGQDFLVGQSLAMSFLAVDFLGVGVFQACGMGKKSLIFAILRKVILEIPALFILNAIFPLYGLAYAPLVAEVVLAVAAVIFLTQIIRDLMKEAS